MVDYDKYWDILDNLDVLTIVGAAPRSGTDFLHSLFDSHYQVLTLDGSLIFSDFFDNSVSVFGTYNFLLGGSGVVSEIQHDNINLNDFFNEFAWKNLHKFNSKYDNLENMGNLGYLRDESNIVDIEKFVFHATYLANGVDFTSRNALLAIYGAYAITRGDDLSTKKVLLHQVHKPEYVAPLAKDFPGLKVIACMRDPRVYVSKIISHQNGLPPRLSSSHIGTENTFVRLTTSGIELLSLIKNIEVRTNVLERLHDRPKEVISSLCNWIGIEFHSVLMHSTWSNKQWLGDNLSDSIKSSFDSNRYKISKKEWESDLSIYEIITIEIIMRKEMRHYGYKSSYDGLLWHLFVPFLILIPTKYELKVFYKVLKRKKYSLLFWIFRSVSFRIFMFLKKFFMSFYKEPYLVRNL